LATRALLIVDMQHDFVDEDGAVPCQDALKIVSRIKELSLEARRASIPIIYTREVHRPQKVDFGRELDGGETLHCVEGTRGAEIVEELAPKESDYVINKRRYSAFFGTDLAILLKGLAVDTLFITGAATDVCVYLTAMDGHQFDFKVRIPKDCVAGTSQAAHEAALAAVERLQEGAVTDSSQIIQNFHETMKAASQPN
jgi:nicotinamidase-related amidase